MPLQDNHPGKFYTISEVSRETDLPDYTIRYWEKELGIIRPARKASGRRLYTAEDIDRLNAVKDLVYRKKMTLAGAKRYLLKPPAAQNSDGQKSAAPGAETLKLLREIHKELCAIAKE